jgi:hypothetical protein
MFGSMDKIVNVVYFSIFPFSCFNFVLEFAFISVPQVATFLMLPIAVKSPVTGLLDDSYLPWTTFHMLGLYLLTYKSENFQLSHFLWLSAS